MMTDEHEASIVDSSTLSVMKTYVNNRLSQGEREIAPARQASLEAFANSALKGRR
jgi:hypothetical protein